VKVLGPRFAAIGFILCVQAMTGACGARSTPAEASPPAQPTETPETPAPAAPTPDPGTAVADCALIGERGEPVTTVALGERIDPSNAPHPTNDSEALLFRQIYETLIRVDCHGRVQPGLAASWRRDDGRTWIVSLRENARFSDGTPVMSRDVRASWVESGVGGELRPTVGRLVESVAAVDDRTVAITVKSLRTDLPLALAHTDLAIARRTPDSRWPLGTRTDGAAPEQAGTDFEITVKRHSLPNIRLLIAPDDPRDLLDRGVDVMLTRDPAALDYAATLPQFQAVPLEWHRTHVLLTPGRPAGAPGLSDDARHVLAADAVRGEARGATGPFWWEMVQDCEVDRVEPPQRSASTPRIVYDARDTVAHDLAERLVGLARSSGPAAIAIMDVLRFDDPRRNYQRATALTGGPLTLARRRGGDAGYVMSLDRRSLDPCRDIQVLVETAPWLDPQTIAPLVETRLRAIVRRGKSGLSAEWDGGLLIAGAGSPR
jgi:hypothetical protein